MDKQPHLFKRLIKNNIFRLSLLYTLLFIIAALVTVFIAYTTIEKNIQTSIEKEIQARISGFDSALDPSQFNFTAEQQAFIITKETKPRIFPAEHRTLFIGKSNYDANIRRRDIVDALGTAFIVLILFGFFGGLVISYQSIKRIDRISRVSQTIIDGNLSLRVPPSEINDDIAELGNSINNMLDRIDQLMQNTREVSNNIAHDLRTPLTRLRANIETIARKSDGDIQAEAHQALAETDNLLNTFSSLLRIAQVESGTAEIQKHRVNLSTLVEEVMDFYEVLAEEKQQNVRLDLAKNIYVIGDKTLLSQAVVNLFTNAVKYTPEKGNITITLTTTGKNQFAALTVHDSGSGVPSEDISKLTQRFYRLEKHRNTANGNGLGLAMVKAVIDAHHGNLSFANDIGLKAMIELPISYEKQSKKIVQLTAST